MLTMNCSLIFKSKRQYIVHLFFYFFSLTIKDKTKISLTIKILHLGQGSFTRKVRTIFTLKIIVSIFVKLFLILVLHLRQFFVVRIFVKRATGPHAVLLCVPFGRFTNEDVETIQHFCSYFGEDLMKYVIVLFTGFDNWKRDQEENSLDPTITGFINTLTPNLTEFMQKCRNRYIAFDNTLKGSEAEIQVKELLEIIEKMVSENGNSCYTDENYRKAEIALQKQIEEIRQQKEKRNP